MLGRMWRKKMRSPLAPERAGRLDILALANGHDLRPDKAGVAGPSADGQSQHQVGKPWSEKCGECDGQQNAGQGEKGIHRKGGKRGIDPAAEVAGEPPTARPSAQRDGNNADGDGKRKTCAPEQARESIAAQFVGSGPVRGRRALKSVDQVDGRGIVGREPRRGQSAENKGREQDELPRMRAAGGA